MATDDHTSSFRRFGQAAAQNRRNYSWPNEISRETDDVERGQWTSAHGENVRQRVGSCDLTVRKRVVDNRGEEINGLDKGAMAIEAIYASVVKRFRADEHVPV